MTIQLNPFLFTFKLNSSEDSYKVSTSKKKEITNHKTQNTKQGRLYNNNNNNNNNNIL
jgi:hypothetical protein